MLICGSGLYRRESRLHWLDLAPRRGCVVGGRYFRFESPHGNVFREYPGKEREE